MVSTRSSSNNQSTPKPASKAGTKRTPEKTTGPNPKRSKTTKTPEKISKDTKDVKPNGSIAKGAGKVGAKRDSVVPSSILEKGIIYFFFRGRVNVEEPESVKDVARSYIVLRPIAMGAELNEETIEGSGKARLVILPKKTLPKKKHDRLVMFVGNPKASIEDLKNQFAGTERETKTHGTSKIPAATPFAEGVYAFTSTAQGEESHLAYQITHPTIGELQKDFGLKEKGSFIVSVKNPAIPGPANARLPNPAKYPPKLQKKFGKYRWIALEPELLDYENAQFLIIGEGLGEFGKAVEPQEEDKKAAEKEDPEEELEKLGDEDLDRVEHLKEDDPVFADLGLSSQVYSKMQTTW